MISDTTREALLGFRAERDWEQFHTPRNLAIALSVEAGELLEHFQWARSADEAAIVEARRPAISHEIADLAIYLTYLAHDLGLDLEECVLGKLAVNRARYPVEESKGTARKHNQLNRS